MLDARYLGVMLLGTLCTCTVLGNEDVMFDNDIHYTEAETGGRLRLQSQGKLTDIVDLDKTPVVKRVLCKGNKVLVALKPDEADITWSEGQLLIGSDKWACHHNTLKPGSNTIYAKVVEVKRPKRFVVELHTSPAGPLDMLEDATIKVHYEQGQLMPSRQRRYISNPLRKVLNDVNWNASFTSNIPFNQGDNDQTDQVVNLFKKTGQFEPATDTDRNTTYTDMDFLFRCNDCHGYSHISYYFELVVYKVDNKAVVQKYVMQMEVNSHVTQNYTLHTDKEVTLTKSDVMWRHLPKQVFQTPIAIFKTFPPILLTVDYSSQANIALKSSTKDATRYNGKFNMDGKTVISQKYEIGQTSENDVTVYNWTVTPGKQILDTNRSMNASFSFHQNVTIVPAISWAQKDVDMNLGPPIQISTRPTVNVISTSDTVSRCDSSSVTIHSNVTVAETDFIVDAFGIHIWNVKLMNSLSRKQNIHHQTLMDHCHADCHGPEVIKEDLSMEIACGEPSGPIDRNDKRFESLHQLWGDFVLFKSEEANSSWCGTPGRPCVNCTLQIAGNDKDSACADRMMTTELATPVTRLAKFVKAEWPDRKVVVIEAWDEPTSDYPSGRHGNMSVFYEGRGVEIAITKSSASSGDTMEDDINILRRLSELSVCSRFTSVRHQSGASVSACVEKKLKTNVKKRSLLSRKRRSGHVNHIDVKPMLSDLGDAVRAVKSSMTDPADLPLHGTHLAGRTMELACGQYTGAVSQDDVHRFMRLVEYPLNDVEFGPEGNNDTWCGVETRGCHMCTTPSLDMEDHWAWCGTRTMIMRLATRLQRMAVLTDGQVIVDKALTMDVSDGSSKLYMEGRAARLRRSTSSSLSMDKFAAKAILAGFDFVSHTSSDYIEVCVKLQDGQQAHIVQFPHANLIGVALPLGKEDEYEYPKEHSHESRKPLLFDQSTSTDNIASHFKLHHFVSPGKRYVRLDPVLLNLLELAFDDFKGGFYVVPGSGYRPRSVNMDNIDTRHVKERYRYQMGMAVELKPNVPATTNNLFNMAVALIRVSKTIRSQRLGIGLGCKNDRLYFDVRPLMEEDSPALEVWLSGNQPLFSRLNQIDIMVAKGGTVITARPDPVICAAPVLGQKYFYFNFDLDQNGYCNVSNADVCSITHEHRFNVSEVLQRRLTSAAGTGKLPRPDIKPEIEECIVNTCGGCPSAGTIWKQKVISCTKMILKYLSRASTPFQPLTDKVSAFNTENHESAVHSQACHDGNICVENTQIYSLLMPVITATYHYKGTDELLFGGADNPSPLLEIVEQELAWRADGKVNVYVENAKDVNAMRNVIKILMVYNKNVSDVIFHIDPDANEDDIVITLQRKIEQWSGSVCPSWSRIVTTPFTITTIPRDRKRRSLERSKDRNKMKVDMKNWEVDWMLKS